VNVSKSGEGRHDEPIRSGHSLLSTTDRRNVSTELHSQIARSDF
jgi:hypothetical protein